MNIRPIDLQVIIPHATDIGKMQATQNSQQVTQQQLFAEQLQRQTAAQQGQVQGAQRVEMTRIHRDKPGNDGRQPAERREADGRQEKDGAKQPEPPSAVGNDPLRGQKIDITF